MGGSLQELDLSNARLSGTIPTEFGMLTALTNELNLNGNRISGYLPTELGDLTKLAALSLHDNLISGIPCIPHPHPHPQPSTSPQPQPHPNPHTL